MRPTAATAIVAISIYVLIAQPEVLPAYPITGVIWLALFVPCSLYIFGAPLPPYYRMTWWFSMAQARHRLAGVLLSPSRGLLIYVPVVVFVLYLVADYWKELKHKRLAMVALAVIAADLTMVSMLLLWWGGWSYGPRELTDTIPFFVLLAILGVRAFLDDLPSTAPGRSHNRRGIGPADAERRHQCAWRFVRRHQRLERGGESRTASRPPWDWSHAQVLAPLNAAPATDVWKELLDQQLEILARRARVKLAVTGRSPQPATGGGRRL